ncbi:AmmeMemoRadiSam system radical SAM enzyme [Raineyella antarctica]|uniref:AmmeMemoRadiSam system radical SAM enzyme n=1 Tax=Raineyella antarctica TaxID=1577474 RepID=UPI001FE1059C|nr:AmmeMemoRadiSam system radical SAM enzyme [Raineyella antarctica]
MGKLAGPGHRLPPAAAGTAERARWWHHVGDGRLQCDVCPHQCQLADGEAGKCFVRVRQGERIVLTTYGLASGFCLDPIEKKPLYHFHPGTAVLSLGTAGCNLSCRPCRTWDEAVAKRVHRMAEEASPRAIAAAAHQWQATSVAFTYNDPAIYPEYAIDIARACHVQDVRTVAVTSGFMMPAVRRELFGVMDAANIDLKGFDEEFYQSFIGGSLRPVLDTLIYVRHRTSTWLEITNLLVPGHNDAPDRLRAMCTWIHDELGPDVPLHFSAYRPDPRMPETGLAASGLAGVPPTPPEALLRAVDIAREVGLRYVYSGGAGTPATGTTYCHGCGAALIEREGHTVQRYRITSQGRCPECRAVLPGAFDDRPGDFGARRIPIRLGN